MQEFLDKKDNEILKETLLEFGLEIEDWYRFWNWNKIQLDGNFSLQEMRCLIEAMNRMEKNHLDDVPV